VERSDLERLTAELGLSDDVAMPGFVETRTPLCLVPEYLLSHLYGRFWSGLVEAMAVGLPVVSTDCDAGPSEILSNGLYGNLCQLAILKLCQLQSSIL